MASLLAFKELERRKIVYLLKPSEIQQFKVLLLLLLPYQQNEQMEERERANL